MESLNKLNERGIILGDWDSRKVSDLPPSWFLTRQVDMLDFRGDLQIRSNVDIAFGRHVRIITASHSFSGGGCGPMELKKCWIDPGVFVGSYAILYNCVLEHNSLVAVGSVVSSMVVPAYCEVEGNPARIVRKYDTERKRWIRV